MQEMDLFLKRGNRKGQSIYKKKVELNTDFIAKDSYILANFSKSSLAKEYHMQLFGSLNASIATYYEFKNQSSICITIENFLSWSLCGLNAAIIYFVMILAILATINVGLYTVLEKVILLQI